MIEGRSTHSIPLHRVLGRHTAELAGRGGGVHSIIEPVRVRGGTPEHLALRLERLAEPGSRYGRGRARRRRRWGRRRRGTRLALRIIIVFEDASRAGVADCGATVSNALSTEPVSF